MEYLPEGASIVMATHLLRDFEQLFDQILFLDHGKIVEKDTPVTDRSTTEEGDDGNRSSVEKVQEESTVYTQDGNGGRVPYVIEEMEPQIQGILVVAEGGDNSQVVQNITEAVMALFGVEAHKIKVMKMN